MTVRHRDLATVPEKQAYVTLSQRPQSYLTLALRVETAAPVGPMLGSAVSEVAPDVPVYAVYEMDQFISNVTSDQRFVTLLLSAFAAMGVLLTAAGRLRPGLLCGSPQDTRIGGSSRARSEPLARHPAYLEPGSTGHRAVPQSRTSLDRRADPFPGTAPFSSRAPRPWCCRCFAALDALDSPGIQRSPRTAVLASGSGLRAAGRVATSTLQLVTVGSSF